MVSFCLSLLVTQKRAPPADLVIVMLEGRLTYRLTTNVADAFLREK